MTGKKTTKSKEPATIAANDREDPQDAAKRGKPPGHAEVRRRLSV